MKLKQAMAAGLLTVLLGTSAWSAPKKAKHKAVKPIKLAPISEIIVAQSNDQGGRSGGSGTSWTLRPNGNVQRSESVSNADSMDNGDIFTPDTMGSFQASNFARLASYLESAHVLDLKPAPGEYQSYVVISVKRGGKTHSVVIPDDTPTAAAESASWATLTLVNAIVAQTDWKTPAGYSINTGIEGDFDYKAQGAQGLTDDERYSYNVPAVTVLNAAGKKVGTFERTSVSTFFRIVLPPGTYRLTRDEPGAMGDADSNKPGTKAYAFRPPATVKVEAGRFTQINIPLTKLPTP